MIGVLSTVLVVAGIAGLTTTGIGLGLAIIGAAGFATSLEALVQFVSLWLPASGCALSAGLAVDPRRFRLPVHLASVVIGLGTIVLWLSVLFRLARGIGDLLPAPVVSGSLVVLLTFGSGLEVWHLLSRRVAS